MDPFEEFEFKPLTKGLGFHKKANEVLGSVPEAAQEAGLFRGPAAKSSERASDKASNKIEELNRIIDRIPAVDSPNSRAMSGRVEPALPREEKNFVAPTYQAPKFAGAPTVGPSPSPAPETKKSEPLFEAKLAKADFASTTKVTEGTVARTEVGFHLGAFLFDALVVVGLVSLFTGVTLAVTGADFSAVWANAQTDLATRLSLVLLGFSVIQLYLILSRSFFGATLGEWAFEISLGSKGEQSKALYPLKVAGRSFLVVLSGFVLFPLLSLVLRKDLAGRLSGVRLGRDVEG